MSIIAAIYSRKSPRCSVFVVLLVLGIAGLVSCGKIKMVKNNDVTSLMDKDTKRYVMKIYGDFFKTPNEQKLIERKYFANSDNIKKAPTIPKIPWNLRQFPDKSTRHENPLLTKNRNAMSGPTGHFTYHGCCRSYRTFTSPPTAISDHNGQEVNLVQLDNERQYFLVDVCWQFKYCYQRCNCEIQVGLFRALVHNEAYDNDVDPEDQEEPIFLVKTVRLGGCCKCKNY